MITNEAKQMPFLQKFRNFCVEASTCAAVGGGGFWGFYLVILGVVKKIKTVIIVI